MARTGLAAKDPKYLAIKAIIESETGLRAARLAAANVSNAPAH
jgi:hypothetical protein